MQIKLAMQHTNLTKIIYVDEVLRQFKIDQKDREPTSSSRPFQNHKYLPNQAASLLCFDCPRFREIILPALYH